MMRVSGSHRARRTAQDGAGGVLYCPWTMAKKRGAAGLGRCARQTQRQGENEVRYGWSMERAC